MAKRILMVILPGDRGDGRSLARSAAEAARATGGSVRMAYIAPVPGPRMDRYDYLVATSEQEIERITADASARLARLSWEFDAVPVEQAIRFGGLGGRSRSRRSCSAPSSSRSPRAPATGLRRQLLAWYLGRALSPRVPVVLWPAAPDGHLDRRLALASAR